MFFLNFFHSIVAHGLPQSFVLSPVMLSGVLFLGVLVDLKIRIKVADSGQPIKALRMHCTEFMKVVLSYRC